MMKIASYYWSILIVPFFFFSCSSEDKETTELFDFGEITYDESFVGLLKNRPSLFIRFCCGDFG